MRSESVLSFGTNHKLIRALCRCRRERTSRMRSEGSSFSCCRRCPSNSSFSPFPYPFSYLSLLRGLMLMMRILVIHCLSQDGVCGVYIRMSLWCNCRRSSWCSSHQGGIFQLTSCFHFHWCSRAQLSPFLRMSSCGARLAVSAVRRSRAVVELA